ncbi:MAG: hypothetical protein WCJ69_14710 [Betaproteobacteria bacterium]
MRISFRGNAAALLPTPGGSAAALDEPARAGASMTRKAALPTDGGTAGASLGVTGTIILTGPRD